MFMAHFAIGFGAKYAAPKVSLGTLFLAAQFIDLLWPTLLLLGSERVNILTDGIRHPPLDFVYYPFSHSLLMVTVWAAFFAVTYFALHRSRLDAIVLGLAVVSHWLLDLIVHYPDLPLYPGNSPLMGFAVWSSPMVALALEFTIFVPGVWLYLRATKAIDTIGNWALWPLIALLIAINLGNTFGAPPHSVVTVAWIGQAQWLLVAWGYWVDKHRSVVSGIH